VICDLGSSNKDKCLLVIPTAAVNISWFANMINDKQSKIQESAIKSVDRRWRYVLKEIHTSKLNTMFVQDL